MSRVKAVTIIKLMFVGLLGAVSQISAGMAQTAASKINLNVSYNRVDLTLHSCARKGTQIQCGFLMTSTLPGAVNYKYNGALAASRLIDDTHVEHAQVSGYFLTGNNKASEFVTLVPGDSVELIQIFAGADPDIKKVNVIFGDQYISTDLN